MYYCLPFFLYKVAIQFEFRTGFFIICFYNVINNHKWVFLIHFTSPYIIIVPNATLYDVINLNFEMVSIITHLTAVGQKDNLLGYDIKMLYRHYKNDSMWSALWGLKGMWETQVVYPCGRKKSSQTARAINHLLSKADTERNPQLMKCIEHSSYTLVLNISVVSCISIRLQSLPIGCKLACLEYSRRPKRANWLCSRLNHMNS